MTTTTNPTTAEELLAMPDDGFRYELVRGELRKMAPTGQTHGEYALSIGASLRAHVKSNKLGKAYGGETGFKLETGPDHVRAPDAAFVSNERLSEIGESDGFAEGPPSLAVEVVSPGDRYTYVEDKVADWLDHGTLAVVVVNPRRRTVNVYRSGSQVALGEADVLAVEDVVPGWRLPVGEIFE